MVLTVTHAWRQCHFGQRVRGSFDVAVQAMKSRLKRLIRTLGRGPKAEARRRCWGIISRMPAAPGATKAVGMVPDEEKFEPKSKGLATPRKKKPKELAVITECCTGCAGSPACVEYCPVEDCMFWVPDEDNPPFGRIAVDPILCIGCKKCLSKGPDGCFLDGCPWDAIAMVDTVEVEKEVGPMAI